MSRLESGFFPAHLPGFYQTPPTFFFRRVALKDRRLVLWKYDADGCMTHAVG